jgi:hypothetical protein
MCTIASYIVSDENLGDNNRALVYCSGNNVIVSIIDKTLEHFESKIVSSDDEKFGRETNPIGIGSNHKTIGKIF